MFQNNITSSHINNWRGLYEIEAKDNLDSRSKSMRKIDKLIYGEANKEHASLEKAHKMKATIRQSQVSPAESLDSVGTLNLSSIDDGNCDSTDDKEGLDTR